MTTSITSLDAIPAPAPVPAKPRQQAQPQIRGRYDAARHGTENAEYWANADHLSANAANSWAVRSTLIWRSRYECANNGNAKGLLRGRRNDLIGTGPRLQLTLPETFARPADGTGRVVMVRTPASAARTVERLFRRWMDAADIAQDLRVMVETADRDGEVFAVMITNPGVDDPVKLDLRLYEAEECSTPDLVWNDPLRIDGIVFDPFGNPVEYHFLKRHPGDMAWGPSWEYDRVAASHVLHWYDPDRPRQSRGIPALTPGLPLFSQLRRYTLATLGAAEVAANMAGILKSDVPPSSDAEDAPTFEAMDSVPIPRNSLMTLPAGWELSQFDPRQPTTTYREFRGEVLTEAGRSVNAPRNVSTGSSAEYNYSSGRLDHLPVQRGARIDRDRFRLAVLNRLFRAWHAEASIEAGHLPAGLPPFSEWDWSWQWDGFESIDREKDAKADAAEIANGTRSPAEIITESGRDPEEVLRVKARYIRAALSLEAEYGLPPGSLTTTQGAASAEPQAA